MTACVYCGIAFLAAMLAGVFLGVERLILPGFLGLCFCWGLAIWLSEAWYRREVRQFRLRENQVRKDRWSA